MPYLQLFIYSFTLWLGFYLLGRDASKLGLRYAGLGLISYALSLALAIFLQDSLWLRLPVMLPSIFWLGAVFHLLPDVPISNHENLLFRLSLPYAIVAFFTGIFNPILSNWMSLALPIFFLIGLALRWREFQKLQPSRPSIVVLATAALFFFLSSVLVLLPPAWLSQDWAVLLISLDLLLLGFAVAVLDAYDEGISFKRDALRSLLASTLVLLLVVGQVLVVMAIRGVSQELLILCFFMITTLLLGVVFYEDWQALLDSLIFGKATSAERESLRAASAAILRRSDENTLKQIDEAEFKRLTRRALSHYSDLNKLAASPLMNLTCLDEHESILERANALKNLLRDTVEQLKPESQADFAPQDEWRFYNVLYFPYIRGLKPYSTRLSKEDLSQAEQAALDWFRAYVPERTLYNWQNSAADLVAQAIWEQVKA